MRYSLKSLLGVFTLYCVGTPIFVGLCRAVWTLMQYERLPYSWYGFGLFLMTLAGCIWIVITTVFIIGMPFDMWNRHQYEADLLLFTWAIAPVWPMLVMASLLFSTWQWYENQCIIRRKDQC